jgi:hypothetical protein
MGLLDMNGSYPLSHETIDQMVSRTSPGNYALGYMDGSTFMVFYVGRSDSDVKRRLREWVGAPSRYERYAPCAKAGVGISSPAVPPPGRSSGRSRRDRCRQQLHELRVQLRKLRRSGIRQGVPQLPRLRGQRRPRQRGRPRVDPGIALGTARSTASSATLERPRTPDRAVPVKQSRAAPWLAIHGRGSRYTRPAQPSRVSEALRVGVIMGGF